MLLGELAPGSKILGVLGVLAMGILVVPMLRRWVLRLINQEGESS